MTETKPGITTTEFWLALFTNLIAMAQLTGVWQYAPDGQNKWVLVGMAIVNAVYAVGRGKAKQGVPYDPNAPKV